MNSALVYRIETKNGDGLYIQDIGILDSPTPKTGGVPSHRPFPQRNLQNFLWDRTDDRKSYLFGFRTQKQATNWIKNPQDFAFLSKNYVLSLYQVDDKYITEDKNQLVFNITKAKLIKQYSLKDIQPFGFRTIIDKFKNIFNFTSRSTLRDV